jgi:two-component system phosphate regulon sensor histidine kinase PhoR
LSSKTIRIFVVLALISILGIMLTQFFWFKKASDNHEREFKKNLNIALKEVVKGILKYNNTRGFPPDPVKQVDENTYIVMVNDQINSAVLEHYLVTEFKKFNINQSFEFSIYDCANQKMVEGRYVEGQKESVLVQSKNLPGFKRDNYYFTVYFPHMKSSLFWQMDVWLFSTAVLLIVVVFFGYSLFVILRQKRLSEIQRDFINNMTHEIRTPISTIAISAETLKSPDIIQTPQRLLNYATIIQDEAIKLKTQVERVLSVADNESKIKLYFEKFDLHALIKSISEQMIMNDKGKKVELVLDFQAQNSIIKADKLHISNLITNLIDNSMKYSYDEVVITIHTANTKENKLEISFSDNGIGISKEHQKRIFDKFYRVPKGNIHDVKGFGIGLNFVMLITKMHNGSIKVISTLNQGTMFKLILPQA